MSGGGFSLTGGFWSLFAVQTPGAPYLWVTQTTTNTVVVWWSLDATPWQLQATTNLPSADSGWTNCVYATNGVTGVYVEPTSAGKRFYRLKK
jgi:hypothetical protein